MSAASMFMSGPSGLTPEVLFPYIGPGLKVHSGVIPEKNKRERDQSALAIRKEWLKCVKDIAWVYLARYLDPKFGENGRYKQTVDSLATILLKVLQQVTSVVNPTEKFIQGKLHYTVESTRNSRRAINAANLIIKSSGSDDNSDAHLLDSGDEEVAKAAEEVLLRLPQPGKGASKETSLSQSQPESRSQSQPDQLSKRPRKISSKRKGGGSGKTSKQWTDQDSDSGEDDDGEVSSRRVIDRDISSAA